MSASSDTSCTHTYLCLLSDTKLQIQVYDIMRPTSFRANSHIRLRSGNRRLIVIGWLFEL